MEAFRTDGADAVGVVEAAAVAVGKAVVAGGGKCLWRNRIGKFLWGNLAERRSNFLPRGLSEKTEKINLNGCQSWELSFQAVKFRSSSSQVKFYFFILKGFVSQSKLY